MEDTLTIEGRVFKLLGEQRGGSAVYRGDRSFLRIGATRTIQKDLANHREMEQAGYPVPRILFEGSFGNKMYFIEQSIGEKSIKNTFTDEYKESGAVSKESFERLIRIMDLYTRAQRTTSASAQSELAAGICLPDALRALPLYAGQIRQRFHEVAARLERFPNVITHGDLSPTNIYPNGVIDLEDSFTGPIGFDIATALMNEDWDPDGDYEFVATFRFTEAQKQKYIEHFDTLFADLQLPSFSSGFHDFAFCRALWVCVGVDKWPKIQKWRFNKIVKEYLS